MELLKCPICGKSLNKEDKSWYCPDRHCFDTARSGYVNLLPPNAKKTKDPGDNAEMIAARGSLMEAGYYQNLADALMEYLPQQPGSTVLDIGCGEGYLTRKIKEKFPKHNVLGIDISKYAVDAAGKRKKENLYAVASSAALPVMDGTCDAVINTFAPIELIELRRVLSKDGVFLKIVPAPAHLWHLKELLYDIPYKNPEDTFSPEGFRLIAKKEVTQQFTAKGVQIEQLLQMTPYYYKTSKESLAKIASMPELTTGLAFTVLVYQK